MKTQKDAGIKIEAFMRNDQFNFIKAQVTNLVLAHGTSKDKDILEALKSSSHVKIEALFPDLTANQQTILNTLFDIKEDVQARHFLEELRTYVIPFKKVTEKTATKLFPKIKKLKVTHLEELDFREISYLGWYDIRLDRKFLIFEINDQLIGVHGTFRESKKGICSICSKVEEVGLFMAKVKSGRETYTSRGNYICKDSQKCNQNFTTLAKLHDFVDLVKAQ